MAEIIEDRVQETTTSVGTGNISLAGAVSSYRSFASVCAIGDQFYGTIVAVDANGAPTGAWECGHYTYSAVSTITRTSVTSSSNNGAAVNFAAGVKRVFIDLTAAQVKLFQSSGTSSSNSPFGLDPSLFAASPLFAEEFNGSGLDTTIWNKAIWYQTDDPVQNFSVANGVLNIWPDTGFVNRTIDTDGKFYLNPKSYVEAKVKMPIGLGVNASFWLYNHDTASHPGATIVQTQSGQTPTYATSSFHPINFTARINSDDLTTVASYQATTYATVPDLSLASHVYGLKWDSDGFTFYFDGVALGPKVSATFASRMYILLSVWFNGGSNGTPVAGSTPTGIGNSMQIDYVRAWQVL
jgi:hypothetical protein